MTDFTDAVDTIREGCGFRATVTATFALKYLRQAQRELEMGKTLPRFLLQEDQTVTLTAGNRSVALPTGFIREEDSEPLRYTPTGTTLPYYLKRRVYREALSAYGDNANAGPQVYAVRNNTLYVLPTPDKAYVLTWSYYKKAEVLTEGSTTNAWLTNAPDVLVGEAGFRVAAVLRDTRAIELFDAMRKSARVALFGDIIADEMSGGSHYLGVNN